MFATMGLKMSRAKNIKQDRRGFLRAFLSDLDPKPGLSAAEEASLKKRISVLALKYGKNEAKLTKIGVKTPLRGRENCYCVQISGHDSQGQRQHVDLEYDGVSGKMGPVDVDVERNRESRES